MLNMRFVKNNIKNWEVNLFVPMVVLSFLIGCSNFQPIRKLKMSIGSLNLNKVELLNNIRVNFSLHIFSTTPSAWRSAAWPSSPASSSSSTSW